MRYFPQLVPKRLSNYVHNYDCYSVPATCPRLLVNREKAGSMDPMVALLQGMANPGGLALDSPHNKRDVVLLGDCDEGCAKLADMLGWKVRNLYLLIIKSTSLVLYLLFQVQ